MGVELAGAGPRRQRRGRRPCALGRRSRLARGSVTVTGNSVWRTRPGCARSFYSRSRGTGAECGDDFPPSRTSLPRAWSSTRRHGRRLRPSRRVPMHDVHNKPTKRQARRRQHQTETRRKCRASYPRSLSSALSARRRRRQPPRERMISCPTVLFRPTPFERAGPLRSRRTGPFSLARPAGQPPRWRSNDWRTPGSPRRLRRSCGDSAPQVESSDPPTRDSRGRFRLTSGSSCLPAVQAPDRARVKDRLGIALLTQLAESHPNGHLGLGVCDDEAPHGTRQGQPQARVIAHHLHRDAGNRQAHASA